jgi:tetratricopeptide (TPR) repeat protein
MKRHGKVFALFAATLAIGACATTGAPPPPPAPTSNVEVQEEVGFTITEEGQASLELQAEYDVALIYLEQGRLDEGIAILERVAAASPTLSGPRIDLGIAYHRSNDLAAAESNLLLAIEANPDQPVAHNELGIIYRKTGRFDEARGSYEKALAIYPGFHYARRNLAVLCDLYLADLECALENYEAYMTTVPSDDEASIWISDLRLRLDQ